MPKYSISLVLVFLFVAANATAQVVAPQRPPDTMSLSGPRAGITYLSPGVVDQIKEDFDKDPERYITHDETSHL